MKKPVLLLVLVLAIAAAIVFLWPRGGRLPEPIVHGRDACAQCKMILSQPGLGGETADAGGAVAKFDDLGCLLASLPAAGDPRVWVEDFSGKGLLPAAGMHFVLESKTATPMGHGILAFQDPAAARQHIAEQGGRVVDWAALRGGGAAPDAATATAAAAEPAPVPGGKRPFDEEDLRAGRALFVRECGACHGERGAGDGPAAEWIEPRPRNLTKPQFRLRTTESGQPPASADILRTIERGLPGSAMPAFGFLPAEERKQLAAFVLETAGLLDSPEPAPLADPGEPPPSTSESVAAGKQVYEKMKCASCHGETGRGDGKGVDSLRDDAGQPVRVRDFTDGVFRGGSERKDLYYRFMTGMDGSPMPSYADSIEGPERWALVDYVLSLRTPPAPLVRPADPIAAGMQVAAKHSCRGCHVLHDGKGGKVGPDLRISAAKLNPAWIRGFLKAPREAGKLYPWRPHRMPHLGLDDEEVGVLTSYLLAVAKKKDEPVVPPDVASFPAERVEQGKGFYAIKCAQCHQLGKVVETPPATQQGPDLIQAVHRVDYKWSQVWILDPKKVDPESKMTIPGLSPAEVESVCMFVWKASVEANGAK